jgi:lipopolysaccharide export system permease protein
VGILWLVRAVRFLRYITEDGVRFSIFLKLSIYILPALLVVIIPLSVFLTAIITYNKLIENRELVILQGAGLKKFSLITPAIFVALIAVVFCYFLTLFFMPFANRGIRDIREEIKNNYSSIMLEKNSFNELRNITIYVKNKDDRGNLFGILIYDNQDLVDAKKKHTLIYAKTGIINKNALKLSQGNIQKFFNINNQIPEFLYFDTYNMNLSEYNVRKINFVLKLSDMYLNELYHIYKKGDKFFTKKQILAEINYRLTAPLFSIILTLIGSSFILYGGFNRMGKNKNIVNSSVSVILFFLFSMYLYKLADNLIIANYLLHFLMAGSIIMSFILIKDTNYANFKSD